MSRQPGSLDLDQTDLRLLHGLQIEPRASWSELAPVVGVDAATLARRWTRLRDDGIVWITGYSRRGQAAFLEIECDLTRIDEAISALQRDPFVFVLDFCSGSRDLLALVFAPDMAALSEWAVQRIGVMKGVRTVRTHLVNEILIEGGDWRLRALAPDEAARVRPPRPPRARAARHVPDDLREAIEHEVWADGRVSVAAIAERHGFTPQRVADGIATLRAHRQLRFRTDIARAVSGWPVYTWYFVEAPARTIEAARAAITAVPEVRLAFTASSRYNLILAVWLRQIADVNRFEMAREQALQGSRIADRSVVLRMAKLMGHTVGPDTRATGFVGGRQ